MQIDKDVLTILNEDQKDIEISYDEFTNLEFIPYAAYDVSFKYVEDVTDRVKVLKLKEGKYVVDCPSTGTLLGDRFYKIDKLEDINQVIEQHFKDLDYQDIKIDKVNITRKYSEAEDFDAILQVFKDLDLAIITSSELDELNATCLSLIEHCKENNIKPSTVVKALSQEAKDKMQQLWQYEDPLTDEDILNEFWNLEEATESKNKVEAKSKKDTECPVCSSQDIDYYSLNDEGTKVRRQCSCNNCNSTFEFVYNLVLDEIENVVDNSKEI